MSIINNSNHSLLGLTGTVKMKCLTQYEWQYNNYSNIPKHFIIWYSWSISESPGNNGSPVNISTIRQPHAQTSTGLYMAKNKEAIRKRYNIMSLMNRWVSSNPTTEQNKCYCTNKQTLLYEETVQDY